MPQPDPATSTLTAPQQAMPVYGVPLVAVDGMSHVVRDDHAAAALLSAEPVPTLCARAISPAPLGRTGHTACQDCAQVATAFALPNP